MVGAMSRELAPLLRASRHRQAGGVELFELGTAVVAIGGVGRNAAQRAVEVLIVEYSPRLIVSAGVAGALSPKLRVGDVVCAREVVDADSGLHFATSGGEGVVVTVSAVSGPEAKRMLAQRWKADVVDMEAAAVGAAAQASGIEFAAIKAISDELDFVLPPLGKFVDGEGKFHTLGFVAYVALRPRWWKAVRQLNVNTRVAAAHLGDALSHLTDQELSPIDGEKTVGT